MKCTYSPDEGGPFSEMVIVDTFTKLIFGEEEYGADEKTIIDALRAVDANVTRDGYREMGEYLRALGVIEMVQLVSRVQAQLACDVHTDTAAPRHRTPDRRLH